MKLYTLPQFEFPVDFGRRQKLVDAGPVACRLYGCAGGIELGGIGRIGTCACASSGVSHKSAATIATAIVLTLTW